MSGRVPQVCLLFGPSAAGGAYIPAFCDFVAMVDGNACMYLGSPRMAEMVIREKVTLEEMGGAQACTPRRAGCGDVLCTTEDEAIAFSSATSPSCRRLRGPAAACRSAPAEAGGKRIEDVIPADENKAFDMMAVIREIVDEDSLLEIKALFAREILIGFARASTGAPSASSPTSRSGSRRGSLCRLRRQGRALHLAVRRVQRAARLLADVPGFMIGTEVERQGIIRTGPR